MEHVSYLSCVFSSIPFGSGLFCFLFLQLPKDLLWILNKKEALAESQPQRQVQERFPAYRKSGG